MTVTNRVPLLLVHHYSNIVQCIFLLHVYAGLCSETTFTRALESSCVAAALHCADIQNLIHAFGGQKRGTIQWQTFLDALRNTYDMNDKQESHVNRPSQQCMVGREGYNSSPSAFHRSSSRGKSPVSLKTSTSYNLNSKSNKGTNNYSDTSFPSKQKPVLVLHVQPAHYREILSFHTWPIYFSHSRLYSW